MRRYAQSTTVSVEKSKGEIERVLARYGATAFVYGTKLDSAMVGFTANQRSIRFILPLPRASEFKQTPGRGYDRSDADAYRHWEQACRQAWRALTLAIKAKLEAVEAGIATFENEFLAYTVLPGGQTVGDWANVEITQAIKNGLKPAPLLALHA